MSGPPPKVPEQRRRRNVPTAGEWVEISPLAGKPIVPALSMIDPHRRWHARTKRMWDVWRRDPVTSMWTPADLAYGIELAYLHDEWVSGERPGSGSEVRLRADGLGLTPKGKQQLRWRIAGGGGRSASLSAEVVDEVAVRRKLRERGVKATDPKGPS